MSQLYFVVVGSNAVRQAAPLRGVAVTGLIRDAVAEYTMTQTFENPLPNHYVEAAYTFPLYEGVAVVGFQAEVGERRVVGKVGEKAAAREDYEEAVRDGKTASLMEQDTPEAFHACLGNVPPKQTVSIRITLVSELRHDAGENQVRFVLPTTIAPRHGTGFTFSNSFAASKLSINMACAMSKPITSVQSPSHTIEVHVGTTSETVKAYAFDPNRARVSLTEDSLLDRDLVIIVQALGLDQPRALVERHPTDQTHAISLTFQPRFALQPLRAAELVFLVGAGNSRAGEALALFLKYIPFENHYFNVIGPSNVFRSTYQALFPASVEHNAESLRVGIQYALRAHPEAELDIPSAFREVCQRRRRDVPTQIFLLTDGRTGNVEQLGSAIPNAVDKEEMRVFCLGVGDGVSHHVIGSLARAGRGYAQVVMAGERMERKVFNMVKAALTPPVTGTAIEWTDSVVENFVMVEGEDDDLVKEDVGKPVISLFSDSDDSGAPPVVAESSDPLPEVSAAIYQAPFKLPVVCPGARFTAYAILSPTTPLPRELVLRGVSPDGPVELRVKVESVVEGETVLHSLAARALARDFEEASSSIHALGKALGPDEEQKLKQLGVSVTQRGGRKRSQILPLSFNHVAEITKQKLIDVGVTYHLSTKYTSWVAIDEEGHRNAQDVVPAGSYVIHVAQSAPQVLQPGWSPPSTAWFGQISGPSIFGQKTTALSFGASQAASWGATPGPAFGTTQASSAPAFGGSQDSSGALFGRATPASAFGATQASSTPAFGTTPNSAFGAANPISAFGTTPTSAFGATQTPAFGATQTPAFGATPTYGAPFGAPQAPAFGAATPTSAFGATPTSAFGATFGAPFGAPQGSLFRASTAQTVASPFSSSASLFESAPAPQASLFGSAYLPQQVRWEQTIHQQQVLQADDQAATSSSDHHTRLRSLLQHQSFHGLFPLVPAIADLFSTSVDHLRTKLGELRKQCTGLTELAEEQWEAIWATCLAVEFMKSNMKELEAEWELDVGRAERQVESLLKNSEHLARFKAAAKAP
jgi:hypothetical protein